MLDILDGIKGPGMVNKTEGPPEGTVGVDDVVPAIFRQQQARHLPAAVWRLKGRFVGDDEHGR